MPTNLAIDDALVEQAKAVAEHRTKKAAVTEALEEYIRRRRQTEITELFGSIDYDESYEYKEQRRKR